LHVAIGILQHHDRVVDHPAYGYRQACEGDDVQRQVIYPGEEEGGEHRGRQRDRGDQGCAYGAQEGEDHQYREYGPDERLLDEPVYRLLDVGRSVGHDHDLIPPDLVSHVIEYSLDLLCNLDGVGVCLLDHVKAQARLAVGTRDPR
jgi:hypothetical protein